MNTWIVILWWIKNKDAYAVATNTDRPIMLESIFMSRSKAQRVASALNKLERRYNNG